MAKKVWIEGRLREKRELKSSLFLRFHRGVLRHPPMGALCFVTLSGVARGLPCPSESPVF